MKRSSLALSILLASTCMAQAEPMLPAFDPANFEPMAPITNPYLPLIEGFVAQISGQINEADSTNLVTEVSTQTFEGPGPVIAGVPTTLIRDLTTLDGILVEEALDYYAQDQMGNVWYMGEDVTNLTYDDDDKVTGTDHHGTWRAGVGDALPGFAMPANPVAGMVYFQEHAPSDDALDLGEIMGVDGNIDGPSGHYGNVLAVFETSLVEPDLREIKYYAPGVGPIRTEEGVDDARSNPEAFFELNKM